MKAKLILLLSVLIVFLIACNSDNKQNNQAITKSENTLTGKWVRIGQNGPVGFDFKEDGLVECDFGNDQTSI